MLYYLSRALTRCAKRLQVHHTTGTDGTSTPHNGNRWSPSTSTRYSIHLAYREQYLYKRHSTPCQQSKAGSRENYLALFLVELPTILSLDRDSNETREYPIVIYFCTTGYHLQYRSLWYYCPWYLVLWINSSDTGSNKNSIFLRLLILILRVSFHLLYISVSDVKIIQFNAGSLSHPSYLLSLCSILYGSSTYNAPWEITEKLRRGIHSL